MIPHRHPMSSIQRLSPQDRHAARRHIAILCLTLCSGAAWTNEGQVVPPGGAAHEPAVNHPHEHFPGPGTHPSDPKDPLHPNAGLPGHESAHDPLHPEPPNIDPLHPIEPVHPRNTGNDPATHGSDPGTVPGGSHDASHTLPVIKDSSVRYDTAMKAAQDWQTLLRGVDGANSVWETLRRSYNRVMGNPRLPAGFGHETYLPENLQDLLRKNNGNYEAVLRSNLGDLDRELLRATFDKDYYREPLMGYKSYDKFVQKRGAEAKYQDIQTLSPVDRLQYLMTFGKQVRARRDAAQQLEHDLRAVQVHDSQMLDLESARKKAWEQVHAADFMFSELTDRYVDKIRQGIDDDDDWEDNVQPGAGGKTTPGESHPGALPAPVPDPTVTPPTPPVSPSSQHQGTLDAITRHRIVWEASRRTDPGLFKRLGNAYERFVGNARLPDTFNDPSSLPEHLQSLLTANGGYENVMRLDIGDLDREVLRATFDPTYYKEPLMGYTSYAKFIATYGDNATSAQARKLSPPDRLQFLANHSKQSNQEYAAIQRRMLEYQREQQTNARQAQLDQLREEVDRLEALNEGILGVMLDDRMYDIRKLTRGLDMDDDI